MKTRFFVICGTFEEFRYYTREHQLKTKSLYDYVYCDSVVKTRGIRDVHGVFYGTWYNLPNIRELLMDIRSRNNQLPLQKLYEVLENVGK